MTDEDRGTSTKTLELYVRSLSPPASTAQLDAVLDRLDDLEATDRIASYSVHVWGKQVRPTTADQSTVSSDIHDRLTTFRAWAEREGMALAPSFRTKDVRLSFTDEAYTVVILPVMTLAEYVDDDLTFVAPCTDGETVYTVHDRLEALEKTEPPTESERASHRVRSFREDIHNV